MQKNKDKSLQNDDFILDILHKADAVIGTEGVMETRDRLYCFIRVSRSG